MLSLETAKELKWQVETLANYHIHRDGSYFFKHSANLYDSNYVEVIPCPSLEELLEAMPKELKNRGYSKSWTIFLMIDWFNCSAYYVNGVTKEFETSFNITPLSEAVAKLYIKLRNEGLIK